MSKPAPEQGKGLSKLLLTASVICNCKIYCCTTTINTPGFAALAFHLHSKPYHLIVFHPGKFVE